MAARLKSFSEFFEVIDLTIESNPDRIIFIGHGLFACGGEIDDAQTLMPKTDRHIRCVQDQLPFVVRAPMAKGVTHATE